VTPLTPAVRVYTLPRIAILLTGMPGSGKSIVSEVAAEMGIRVYNMGDVIREEAKRRGLPLTDKELGQLARELRLKYGKGAIAKLTAQRMLAHGEETCLIDGVRSLEEVETFRKYFDTVTIVAVHSSPRTRFERLKRRGREDDPKSWEDFVSRDLRELSLGVGNVIALADFMIVNEGSIEDLKREARSLLANIVGGDYAERRGKS